MKRFNTVSVSLTLVACLGMVMPPVANADGTAQHRVARSLEVSLHEDGLLIGQVVGPQGKAKEKVEVAVLQQGRELVRTTTDNMGRFAVKGLRGGSYELATTNGQIPVRVWASLTAPPTSAVGALLVDGTVVRGQSEIVGSGAAGHSASFNQNSTHYVTAEGADEAAASVDDASTTYVDGSAQYYDASAGANAYQGGGYSASYGASAGGGGGLFGLGVFGGGGVIARNPWLFGAGVAAAVAIPVAVSDDDDDAS